QQLTCIQLCRVAQRVQNIWRACILTCLGCPSPTTRLCGTFGLVCCPARTVCTAGTCVVLCGAVGQPCCHVDGTTNVPEATIGTCNPGLVCNTDTGTCVVVGEN